jgi:CDP-2,3-bis-(O-geranylgeranyl)-sn-glycerol synthase
MAIILSTLLLILPAYAANVAPILATKIKKLTWLNYPLDHYRTFRKKRLLGDHKTYRGLVSGVGMGLAAAFLQWIIIQHCSSALCQSLPPWQIAGYLLYGLMTGIGVIGGDALKSFFKRQLNKAEGEAFFPFDQIDYLLGFTFLTFPLIHWTVFQWEVIIFSGLLINPIANLLGFRLKLKQVPW